jgi:hypothetical protein
MAIVNQQANQFSATQAVNLLTAPWYTTANVVEINENRGTGYAGGIPGQAIGVSQTGIRAGFGYVLFLTTAGQALNIDIPGVFRPGDSTGVGIPPTSYDRALVATGSTPRISSDGDITVVASSTQLFEYNYLSAGGSSDISLTITISGTEQATYDGLSRYIGQFFRFTDTGGTLRVGQWIDGIVAF